MGMDEHAIKQLRIIAVDDDKSTLLLLRQILEREGYAHIEVTTDPARLPELFADRAPDLVLLDLHMPGIDGFELMERLHPLSSDVPFLVLTADATQETRRRALAAGASDFLTKPLDRFELLLRVRNLLDVKQLHDRLREQNNSLELQVAQRTLDLDQARVEILERLALAAEYRDDETQEHARRIGRTCGLVSTRLGLPDAEVELMSRAAPLHDLGKIGISDLILLKPGRLTSAEFAIIQTHTRIGAQILAGSHSPVLRLAEQIALSHHERWDGGGYPGGLAGDAIPLAGRIVAIADVFDALSHARPYKQAWPVEECVEEIVGQSARQFDPAIVEAFAGLDHPALLEPVRRWELPAGVYAQAGTARSVLG